MRIAKSVPMEERAFIQGMIEEFERLFRGAMHKKASRYSRDIYVSNGVPYEMVLVTYYPKGSSFRGRPCICLYDTDQEVADALTRYIGNVPTEREGVLCWDLNVVNF